LHPVIPADDILTAVAAFDFLAELFDQAHVTKRLHTSDHLAPLIFQQSGRYGNGVPLSFGVNDVNGFVDDRFAGCHRFTKGAVRLANVRPQDVAAPEAHRLFARDPRNVLSRPVKRRDVPIRINGEDAFGNRVQDYISFCTWCSALHDLFVPHENVIDKT
jgi:hypothetical protein